MPVTMVDIARASGLSQPTVSLALSGKGRIPAATRARVQAIAQSLGYRPHLPARSMRSGSLSCIALLQSTVGWRSLLPPPLLDGIHDGLSAHQQHLIVAKLADAEFEREDLVPRILRGWMVDGLLVNLLSCIPPGLHRRIKDHGVPAVWMNVDQPEDAVHPDDHGGAFMATKRLLDLGHRRIAYADYAHAAKADATVHYSVQVRRRGYAAAMESAGLRSRFLVAPQRLDDASRIPFSSAWAAAPERPTAVLAYGQTTMLPILAALGSAGLRVPHDCSLMMFSDEPSERLGLCIDCMLVPCFDMGIAAVDMLTDLLLRPRKHLPSRTIPCVYDPCGSSAPPP